MISKGAFRIVELIIIALAFVRTGLLCSFDVFSVVIFIVGILALLFDWFVLEDLQ